MSVPDSSFISSRIRDALSAFHQHISSRRSYNTVTLAHAYRSGQKDCGMDAKPTTPPAARICRALLPFVAAACVLLPRTAVAQGLTGALIGTVKDDQGGVLARRSRPCRLPGADWWPGDPDHERERANCASCRSLRDCTSSTSNSTDLRPITKKVSVSAPAPPLKGRLC